VLDDLIAPIIIDMNEIIVKWNHIYTKDITLSTRAEINNILFADDQVIVAYSEDNFTDRSIYVTLKYFVNNRC
jgi:hypothetical protein